MRANVQYLKNIILTKLADIFDIEHSAENPKSISALHLGNIPHCIDTQVIKYGYFKLRSNQLEPNETCLSLSDAQLLDLFDAQGMLLDSNKDEDSSITISEELKKVCEEKAFGHHSDVQTIALWVALKASYEDVHDQIHSFNGGLGHELKMEMARNPKTEYKDVHEFVQSIENFSMDEVLQYVADVIEFSKSPFSLELTKHSLILLHQGWVNVAALPKKIIIAPPAKEGGARRFVSEKQLARIFLLSSNDVTIINLEAISLDDEASAGINYFIPDLQGQITLPKNFSNVEATSELVNVVGRIHVYQVHFSTNKNLKVIHFPILNGSEPLLSPAEYKYLFDTSISLNNKFLSQGPLLMIHGGDGSQLLSKLADYHSEKSVRGLDRLKYAATFGVDKPTYWQELPIDSRTVNGQSVSLVKDYRSMLLRETILLQIKQKSLQAIDDNHSNTIEAIAFLKQLLVRVERYEQLMPAELNLDGVSTYTDMARFLLGCLLSQKDQALASPKMEWLVSLVVNPIDGPTKGGASGRGEFSAMLAGQDTLIKQNLQLLALKCCYKQAKLDYVLQKLLSISRQLHRLAFRNIATSENTIPVYNIQKMITQFLLINLESEVLACGNLAKIRQFQHIKQLSEITAYLHIFRNDQEVQNISQNYYLIENMLSSWHKIHRMILDNDATWKSEYRKLCLNSNSVVSINPQALVPFTENFNKVIKNNFENEKQRSTCLKQADKQMKKGLKALHVALNEVVFESYKFKQTEIQHYDSMASRNWQVENRITRDLIHKTKLTVDEKLLIDAAIISEKWIIEKKLDNAWQYAKTASENSMVQDVGVSTRLVNSDQHDSLVLQNIRENTPKVIFLHIGILLKLPMGTLHNRVLIEWLKIIKKTNAVIILISDQTLLETENEKLLTYFSNYHVNVVDYLDLSLLTIESLTQTIENIHQKYDVGSLKDSYLIDIRRSQSNTFYECLTTRLSRREMTFPENIKADAAQLKFLQTLSHELNYFIPYINFFKNETDVLPSFPLFFHRVSEFIETALVRDISIKDFASRIEEFYFQKLQRWGGDRLLREPISPLKPVATVLSSYNEYRNRQIDIKNKKNFDIFYSNLYEILENSYDDCKHLSLQEQYVLFDKFYGVFLNANLSITDNQKEWFFQTFKLLIADSFLARYKGYRAGEYGLIEQKRLGLFFNGLECILQVNYAACNKLTTFQKNTVFDALLKKHILEPLQEVNTSNAWFLKEFEKLMGDLAIEKERTSNGLKTVVGKKSEKAKQDFAQSVYAQIPWLKLNKPELLEQNVSYLKEYFEERYLTIKKSVAQREKLNQEEQSILHANVISLIRLLYPFIRELASPADVEYLKGYYQELDYYLKVFFNRSKKAQLLPIDKTLQILMSQENNPIDLVDVPSTKKHLTQLSNMMVINYLIGNHSSLVAAFLNELRSGASEKLIIEQLKAGILANKKKMFQYQKLLDIYNFQAFIKQSDNLLAMLGDNFPDHNIIFSYFDKQIWEHECQVHVDVAHYLHRNLELQICDLEKIFSSSIPKNAVENFRNNIEKFENNLLCFHHHFGLSFYEYRIVYVKLRLLKSLEESNGSVEPNFTLSNVEEAHDCITVLRSFSKEQMQLKISKVFNSEFVDSSCLSSIVSAKNKFVLFFRDKCLFDIVCRAEKYFPNKEDELEVPELENSLDVIFNLLFIRLNKELAKGKSLPNASNFAFLLDDLRRLNLIENSITGESLIASEQLEELHNRVSKHVLEQRLHFLSSPKFNATLLGGGFASFFRGMWSNASTSITKQRNDLREFLDNVTAETNFSSRREELLKDTVNIKGRLSEEAQQLYCLILDETEVDEYNLIDDDLSQGICTFDAVL